MVQCGALLGLIHVQILRHVSLRSCRGETEPEKAALATRVAKSPTDIQARVHPTVDKFEQWSECFLFLSFIYIFVFGISCGLVTLTGKRNSTSSIVLV
jgi:hypothetical protein